MVVYFLEVFVEKLYTVQFVSQRFTTSQVILLSYESAKVTSCTENCNTKSHFHSFNGIVADDLSDL